MHPGDRADLEEQLSSRHAERNVCGVAPFRQKQLRDHVLTRARRAGLRRLPCF
jgi:hypothetical protein